MKRCAKFVVTHDAPCLRIWGACVFPKKFPTHHDQDFISQSGHVRGLSHELSATPHQDCWRKVDLQGKIVDSPRTSPLLLATKGLHNRVVRIRPTSSQKKLQHEQNCSGYLVLHADQNLHDCHVEFSQSLDHKENKLLCCFTASQCPEMLISGTRWTSEDFAGPQICSLMLNVLGDKP